MIDDVGYCVEQKKEIRNQKSRELIDRGQEWGRSRMRRTEVEWAMLKFCVESWVHHVEKKRHLWYGDEQAFTFGGRVKYKSYLLLPLSLLGMDEIGAAVSWKWCGGMGEMMEEGMGKGKERNWWDAWVNSWVETADKKRHAWIVMLR